jgi:hypothetical protein
VTATRQTEEAGFTATAIQVNVDDLSDFQTFLGRELRMNLQPGSDEVLNDHCMGVRFGGRNAGYNVGVATKTYFDVLTASTRNLQEYVNTSQMLVEVIGSVAGSYRASDLTAAGSTRHLDDAISAAFKARSDLRANDQTSETRREAYRAAGPVSPA